MLHTVNTLTIRRYGEIDRTENLSLLRRWWNVFPVRWFNVQKVINEIARGLNADTDRRLTTEIGKLRSYNNILILESLYMAIYILMVNKPTNDKWQTKKKASNLKYYLDTVFKMTGIRIKKISDLRKLKKETQRATDKYNERYSEDPIIGENIPFTQYAYSVFALMEMPYNGNTVMSEFFELIKLAEKKTKQLDKLKKK